MNDAMAIMVVNHIKTYIPSYQWWYPSFPWQQKCQALLRGMHPFRIEANWIQLIIQYIPILSKTKKYIQ